jgi:hypothetical protein
LRLIKDGLLEDNEALLDFSYELIELLAEQGKAYPVTATVHADKTDGRTRNPRIARRNDSTPLGSFV